MEDNPNNRLSWWHGVLAVVLAAAYILFGSALVTPLLGTWGSYTVSFFLVLTAGLFILFTGTKLSEAAPMALPPVRQFFASVGLYIGVTALNSVISLLLSRVIPDYSAREDAINAFVRSMNPTVALLLIAVLPGICEELFCRGFLPACFRGLKKKWLIILVTAMVFGFLHMDLFAFLPTALLGALFAYIALETGSLLIPMLLHFTNNAISVLAVYLLDRLGEEAADGSAVLSFGELIGAIPFYLGIAVFFLWFSGCLFHKKKLFTKRNLAAFIVASVLVTAGWGIRVVQTFASGRTVVYAEQTVRLAGQEAVGSDFQLETGRSVVSASAAGSVRIKLILRGPDGETVSETAYGYFPVLTFSGTLPEGDYSVLIRRAPFREEDEPEEVEIRFACQVFQTGVPRETAP